MIRACILLAIFTGSGVSAETVIIQDDFTTGRTSGKVRGGTFTAEGYVPTVRSGHILYELEKTVRNGYAEFVFKGMDHNKMPRNGDQGFIGQYDGRGITEPIHYLPHFKENFYRWNVQYRQDKRNIKGVISCAAPRADRLNATEAVYPDGDRDWSREPNGAGVTWDPKEWYTMRVEWNKKIFKVLVNGVQKWSTSGPYDYAPVQQRIWLGSAPGTGTKYRNLLPNLVYQSFTLVSYDPVE